MEAMFLIENRVQKLESGCQRATVGELMLKQKRSTVAESEVKSFLLTCHVTQPAQAHRCERNRFHASLRKEENTVSARKSHMKNKELWGSELLLESF